MFSSSRKMWTKLTLIVLSFLQADIVQGLVLQQCVSNVVEFVETSPSNAVTCQGAGQNNDTVWKYIASNGATVTISTCNPSGTCSNNNLYNVSRSGTSSTLTPKLAPKTWRELYGSHTLVCETPGDQVFCQLDVVHRAEVTSCSAQFNTSGTAWTVGGRCDVSKTFSQRGRYSCNWTESRAGSSAQIPSSQTSLTTSDFSDSGANYTRVTCSFSKPLSTDTGTYTYSVLISPGAVQPSVTFSGSNSIELPSVPTTNCPPSYVTPGTTVNCTCNTSSPGNPAGTVQWSGQSGSQLVISDVKPADHGRTFACEVRWGNQVVKTTTYTLQVAAGPDSVTVSGPQPFDTDGSKPMTLTCNASNFRPSVTYAWRRLPAAHVITAGNSFTFTPSPAQDDGAQYECTATNTVYSQGQATGTFNTSLHYPPTSAPVIYNGENIMYTGDPVTLTCSVRGGKPVSAMTVTFDCPGKSDINDITGTTEVNSSLIFDPLVASDNGRVCTCRGRWKNYDWYTLQTQTNLNVYYAPSRPEISYRNWTYPFMKGESPTLYCSFPSGAGPGNPPATLNWQGRSQNEVSLTIGPLTIVDNGRSVQCQASNAFTDHNNQPVVTEFPLIVYYCPVVYLSKLEGDNCTFTHPTTCVLHEGQRVRLNCSAHSNPDPQNVTWQQSGDVLDFVANRSTKTNHTCQVTTKTVSGDSRLPLSTDLDILVLVKYSAEISSLRINNQTDSVALNESDPISLTCTATGRPTPEVKLLRYGTEVKIIPQGDVTQAEEAVLTYDQSSVTCNMAGLYRCETTNGLGNKDTQTATLTVNCGPRHDPNTSTPQDDVNFIGQPESINFILLTFPPPDNNHLTYIGNTSTSTLSTPARDDLYRVVCEGTDRLYRSFCILTIENATTADKGYYNVTFGNQFGTAEFTFHLDVNGAKLDESATVDSPIAAALGGGIAAAAVVTVAVAGVVVYTRRKQVQKHYGNGKERLQNGENEGEDIPGMTDNCVYGTAGVKTNEGTRKQQMVSPYEDVSVSGAESAIALSSRQQNAVPANAGDTYAANTGRPSEESTLYASVDKSKQRSQDSKAATIDAASSSLTPPNSHFAAKTKFVPKLKPEKKPKQVGTKEKDPKRKNKTGAGAVYNNMSPLSMSPTLEAGTVYENYAFEEEKRTAEIKQGSKAEDKTKEANADGLVYTTMQFSESQLKKARQAPPERDITEYVSIDFTRKAPEQDCE